MATHRPVDDPCSYVLADKHVAKKVDEVKKFVLGDHNKERHIRDLPRVLRKYTELGLGFFTYVQFFFKTLLLTVNVTAIFYAFFCFKGREEDWRFQIPHRVAVWFEFLGICWFLLWFLLSTARLIWAAIQEARVQTTEFTYASNVRVCSRMRHFYKAGMRLDFNLLWFLKYISPVAVSAQLAKAHNKVYARYGMRVHRDNCCMDMCCCCCFYCRLWCCSFINYGLVLLLTAISLMAVLLKVLQMAFLGEVNIHNWTIAELLLFAQFLVNLASLDGTQRAKKRGKLELLFYGADCEEAFGERKAKHMFDNLALLALRYKHSLFSAVVMYHGVSSDDINWLYVEDLVEPDRPRFRVQHTMHQEAPGRDKKVPAMTRVSQAGGPRPRVEVYAEPAPEVWVPQAAAGAAIAYAAMNGPSGSPYAPQHQPYQPPGPAYSYEPGYGPAPGYGAPSMQHQPQNYHSPLYPSEVAVEMQPMTRMQSALGGDDPRVANHQRAPSNTSAHMGGAMFPYAFYDHGRAVGAPVSGLGPAQGLKSKYENVLWGVQAE